MNRTHQFLTLVIMTLMLTACGQEEDTTEKTLRPVLYQTVERAVSKTTRVISGTSESKQVNKLSFRSGGILTELNMQLGEKVEQGQLLAKLDNVQAQLNYENAISSRNSAESNMNTAKLNLDRVRALYEKGGAALREFETAKDTYRTAQQNYQSSIRNVEIQKEQINYGSLYAVADGEVAEVNVELNENISAGEVIATINSGSQMNVNLGIPESVINNIKTDMPVKIEFASLEKSHFSGTVIEVSPSIDNNTSTYPVVVAVDKPTAEIKSGMAANVTFEFVNDEGAGELMVPAKAVGEGPQGRFVYLLKPTEGDAATVTKHTVQVGALTAAGFEITSGLKQGEMIVTAGLQSLLDGQQVKYQEDQN